MNYIVTAEPKELFDCDGKSLGMQDKLAAFYWPKIGKRRVYRKSMNYPQKSLKILTFTQEKFAQELCNHLNSTTTDVWKVENQE